MAVKCETNNRAEYRVECFSELMGVYFSFKTEQEALAFIETALKSVSISGINLFKGREFLGARDGAAS